jgi:hypothetical protein
VLTIIHPLGGHDQQPRTLARIGDASVPEKIKSSSIDEICLAAATESQFSLPCFLAFLPVQSDQAPQIINSAVLAAQCSSVSGSFAHVTR